MRKWLVAALVLLLGRGRRSERARPERDRIVPLEAPSPHAETLVLALLGAASACAVGFIVVYAFDGISHQTQWLGVTIGAAFAFLSAALTVAARRLVPQAQHEEPYANEPHEEAVEEVVQIVHESDDRITRRRLLGTAAAGTGLTIGAALVTPALSLGPLLDTGPLHRTPWARGKRLVDVDGRPIALDDLEVDSFVTAYAPDAAKDELGSPLVVVRVEPARLDLPDGRDGWDADGVVAYSKICTHAGCAVSLFRAPLYEPTSERPALVCPCHYSTFDPATGGTVLFGPAGRPLPQLPLAVDGDGHLVADGGFSGAVGPSWWGVRRS